MNSPRFRVETKWLIFPASSILDNHCGNDGVMVGLYDDGSYNLSLTAENSLVMTEIKAVYKSFLIRIYIDEAHQMRRVMATRIGETEKQHHFFTLDDLMIFLLQEIEIPPKGGQPLT